MRRPTPPPDFGTLLDQLDPDRLRSLIRHTRSLGRDRYLPWDELRRRPTPEGLSHEELWLALKTTRLAMQRELPLTDKNGKPFTYALPDEILRNIDIIGRDASGSIAVSEQVTNPATRDRYLVSSLMEEAITSSQLEGATTTRKVAKEMIRSGRLPRTRDERMILNNYNAMGYILKVRNQPLTPQMIREVHRIVTDQTLDNPDSSSRFQLPSEDRVGVYDIENELLHAPPAAEELEDRINSLCDFANDTGDISYVPPVLRAIIVHFMLAYDHPFEDGNGRTARALFYWSMLYQGYWLTEFLSISRILKAAPAKYGRSFLYSEQDDGDLTYFLLYQLHALLRAINDLKEYLDRKMRELRDMQRLLLGMPGVFNHRQIALLEHAAKNPGAQYTVISHGRSHNVVRQTARQDLIGLERRNLLARRRVGRGDVWIPVEYLAETLMGSNEPGELVTRKQKAAANRSS